MGATDPADELARLRAEVADRTHDLSNALGAILNYVAFLSEDLAGTAAGSDYLPHLQSATNRALGAVERLGSAALGQALAPDAQRR